MSAIAPAVTAGAVAGAAPSRLQKTADSVSDLLAPQDTFSRGPAGDWEAPLSPAQLRNRLLAQSEKPIHRDGGFQATEKGVTYSTEQQAKDNFRRQAEHLLRPENWGGIGLTSMDAPEWIHLDSQGKPARGRVEAGDVLKIDSPSGDFFVQIQEVHASPDNVGFTVRPTGDPTSPEGGKTDHFFTEEGSREFNLTRDGRNVVFNTEGKNETLNISGYESHGVFDAVQNAVTGMSIFALGDAYWGSFADHLLGY